MAPDLDSARRVSAALGGESVAALGMTFLAGDALGALAVAGVPDQDRTVSAAASLDLDFAFVESNDPGAPRTVASLLEAGSVPMWCIGGPFGTVASERGWVTALSDVVRARTELALALDAATGRLLREIDDGAIAGANVLVIAEDLSVASGLLMGPDDAFELIIPRLGRLAREAELRGMRAVLHSDGDIRVFLPAMADAGFAGVHIGGVGWTLFEEQYRSARAAGLAVIGGLEGSELREGLASAEGVGRNCAGLAAQSGLLIADDGGLTTAEEGLALASAFRACTDPLQRVDG